jgi:MSHA biogenesis protein MshK
MDGRLSAAVAFLLAFSAARADADAPARDLRDPTRPPSAEAAEEGGTPASIRLQSVLISGRRKIAVINGETVSLGGKVGDATLVGVEATDVTLDRNGQRETVHMFSGIEKKPVRRSRNLREDR